MVRWRFLSRTGTAFRPLEWYTGVLTKRMLVFDDWMVVRMTARETVVVTG